MTDKEKYDWELFLSFCKEKGITTGWEDWWDCWVNAYKLGRIDSI